MQHELGASLDELLAPEARRRPEGRSVTRICYRRWPSSNGSAAQPTVRGPAAHQTAPEQRAPRATSAPCIMVAVPSGWFRGSSKGVAR